MIKHHLLAPVPTFKPSGCSDKPHPGLLSRGRFHIACESKPSPVGLALPDSRQQPGSPPIGLALRNHAARAQGLMACDQHAPRFNGSFHHRLQRNPQPCGQPFGKFQRQKHAIRCAQSLDLTQRRDRNHHQDPC